MSEEIIIRWSTEGKYHMLREDGTFIQEFYPCEFFMKFFDNPPKDKDSQWQITVERR